jgi:integrase
LSGRANASGRREQTTWTVDFDRNSSRELRSRLQRYGVPDIRLHDLRHTHATLALRAGVHPKVLSVHPAKASIGSNTASSGRRTA